MMKEQVLVAQLGKCFPEHSFYNHHISVLHKGRFANAIVYRYKDDRFDLVIKDFNIVRGL